MIVYFQLDYKLHEVTDVSMPIIMYVTFSEVVFLSHSSIIFAAGTVILYSIVALLKLEDHEIKQGFKYK